MATGKQGFVRSAAPQHSLSARRGNEMHVQAPLTAMYVQAVPGLPSHPQAQSAAVQDAPVVPLSMPMMYANQALPFLTLHIAGGTAVQPQRPETPASSPRPKSAGKHVCPHCGRDCLKPSVLEKHLRCHTGERPYPCATCGISFKTQSNLYKHKRTQAHARLSSESSTGAFSSQESTESTREICSSPSLELPREDSGEVNTADGVLGTVSGTKADALGVNPAEGSTEDLCKAAAVAHESKREELSSLVMPPKSGDGHTPFTPNRIPLQRQEALFAKLSRGKTQSHDSTDSGFSESTEHHLTSSLGDSLHNPSLESVTSMDLQEPGTSEIGTGDNKSVVSLQEKQKLEEHILKLISENSVLVDDRHLVNVRPRKTVLSKQGSIDLPTRYTYKDSFHFEIGKQQVSGSPKQDRRGRAIYSSMPTQHSTSLEHAPLTRSSSLPFSVGVQNADRTTLPHQVDAVPLSRRCSAGHIYPFSSVDQQTPSHRLLVRQVAVDCLSATEAERGSLGTDVDCTDTSVEAAAKRCRRKKAQKFAYNKWYMYGGGTFKKLYNTEQESLKSRKSTHTLEQTESQHRDNNPIAPVSASVPEVRLPPGVNAVTSQTSSPVISSYMPVQNSPAKQSTRQQQSLVNQANDVHTVPTKGTEEAFPEKLLSPMPSERKKQKTEDDLSAVVENPEGLIRQQKCAINASLGQSLQSGHGGISQSLSVNALQKDSASSLNRQGSFTSSSSPNQRLFKRHSSPMFMVTVSSASPASSISSDSQAKPSFLPKYQLKIPSSTEGISDSSQKPSEHSKTAPQSHSVTSVTSSGQAQCDTFCTSAVSTLNPVTCATFITQNSNELSKALPQNLIYTSAAISLTPTLVASVPHSLTAPVPNEPLQTFPATAGTARTTILPQSHLLGSTKDAQIYTPTTAAVLQNSLATSVLVPRQQQLPASQSSVEALEIRPTAFQGAEDTFYVQTADLQIVMQLISDEQLAMIEPQIEKQGYAPTGSRSALSTTSGAETIQANVLQERHSRTKQCEARGTVNKIAFSEIPSVTPTSVTEHNENGITSGCGTNLAKGVISSFCPKTENRLGQRKSYFGPDAKVEWSTRSYLKHRPDEDPPAEKPTNQSGQELMHDRTPRNSTSTLSNMKQCSQDLSSTSHTLLASLNNATASLETHHPVLMPAQQHKYVLVSGTLKSVEGEANQRGQPQLAPISSASTSQEEPLSIGLPCTSSTPPRLTSSGGVFTSVVCQHKPLQGANEAFISGQLLQQDSSTQETEAKDFTDRTTHKTRAHFGSHKSTSKYPQEENVKMQLVSQESLKGPPVNSSLQSSVLQQEGGTGSPWSVTQETKSGAEDAGERAGMPETTGMGQEEHGIGNKGETAMEVQPNLSQRVITISTSSDQPDTSSVSISAAPSICAGTDVGRDSELLTQSGCACLDTSEQITNRGASATVVSTLIARSNRPKEKEFPGSHERFSTPATCGHLLAHPLLVNAIQKEVEKETQKKNQDRSPSKISESFCMTSHPESCPLRKSTVAHTRTSISDPTYSCGTHPKPVCASSTHPAEPNAPVCQWGSSYVETEERSSSSDDEGKLVIELE